jgi:hypothetical protein
MALFQCSDIQAADWSVSPGRELTEEYNNNVLFSSQNRISDFTTFIKPRILAAWEAERTRLLLNTTTAGEIYVDHSDLDTVSNDTQATLVHHWTPCLHTTFTGTFKRDETLEQEMEDVGETTVREERYRYGFKSSTTYALTEVWELVTSQPCEKAKALARPAVLSIVILTTRMALLLPNSDLSWATILIQDQQISNTLVPSAATIFAEEGIQTIIQEVTGRTNSPSMRRSTRAKGKPSYSHHCLHPFLPG